MNKFCQIWDKEATCSYNSLPCSCNDANHWRCEGFCHCPKCREIFSTTPELTNEYDMSCCCCENCQYFHNGEYAEQCDITSAYEGISNEYNLNEPEYLQEYQQEGQYLENYGFETNRNYHSDPSSEIMHTSMCKNKHDVYGRNNRNFTFANAYSNLRNGDVQTYNANPLSSNYDEISRSSCQVRVTESKSDSKLNENDNSCTQTRESYYSCGGSDSNQIEMMYQNKKQAMSKSTINQSSIQTIASKASKPTAKRILEKKHRKKGINSGYFEFISPTRDGLEKTSANLSKQQFPNASIHSSKYANTGRYGYFETKEKNYAGNENHQSKKVAFSELDNIPTKISKEVDTSHLKESTMLDKCLSANIKQCVIKTSDKSLSANIFSKSNILTLSDVLKVLDKKSKQQLHTKRSNKMLEDISTKSLTHFKPSHTKQKGSIHTVPRNLSTTKSLSEGSLKVCKQASAKMYGKKENIDVKKDNVVGYRSYLDMALDKMEIQISNKIERALVTYADISNKQQLLNVYNTTIEDPVGIPQNKETTYKLVSSRKEVGTNPSFTMQTLEDVIDSEEVEIDTNDLEERSSLSSHPHSNENRIYNSDASSHNTEKRSILDSSENTQGKEFSVKCDRLQNNSAAKKIQIGNSNVSTEKDNNYEEEKTCKSQTVSQESNHYRYNLKENSSNKIENPSKPNNLKIKDSNKSVTSRNRKSISGVYISTCEHVSGSSSQEKMLREKHSSRNGSDNKNSYSTLAHNQGSDGKTHGSRHKPTIFRQTSLGTIEEESHSHLNLIHDGEKTASIVEPTIPNNRDSVKDVWDVRTSENLYEPHIQELHAFSASKAQQKASSQHDNNSGSNINFSDQHYTPSDYRKCTSACAGYRIGNMNFHENDSCCVRQTCRDCPKKRYYAEVLRSYNERKIQHYDERSNEDQLYEYMLNVPPSSGQSEYSNGEHCAGNKHRNLLNMISFIMFIIMFYGIFQCIDANIRNGQFPWN